MKKVFAFIAALFALAQTAQAASPPAWEGDLFITAVTSACTASGTAAVSAFYRAVYNPHSSTNNKPDAIALFGPRQALVLTSTGTTLHGSVGYQGTYITQSAQTGQIFGTVKYTITPATVTATTPVVQISGTTSNFLASGCTISVVAALGLRH